jgi:hypothetical protein
MFFDQLEERNAMVQSNLELEQLVQTGLAGLGTGLTSSSRASTSEMSFLCPGFNWDYSNMFADRLYSRNMMAESIIWFGHFWLSTVGFA